jgi:hypothetical protein
VEGQSAPTKSEASDEYIYIPPDLQAELKAWWSVPRENHRTGYFNRRMDG